MTEEELNQLVEKSKSLVDEVIKHLNDMNWFVRKSDGLLYYYKYKPHVFNKGNMFSLNVNVMPLPGDKEKIFKEENNRFGFIPKNILIHRDDLYKYKKDKE